MSALYDRRRSRREADRQRALSGETLAQFHARETAKPPTVAEIFARNRADKTVCPKTGDPNEPARTITAGGTHHAIVQLDLSPGDLVGAQRVAAFIAKYYGQGEGQGADEPLHTVTTKDRFALVMVKGMPIVDIGMRMLQPPELYKAQGFPATYRITVPGPTGKPLTKTAQVRMCGNSVSPPLAEALTYAQFADEIADVGLRAAD